MRVLRYLIAFSIGPIIFLHSAAFAEAPEYRELRSGHFIIKYQKEVKLEDVNSIKNISENFYRVITQEFNFLRDKLWLWDNRAKIFIAKDQESYRKDFNCSDWSSACVNYHDKIIYTYPEHKQFKPVFAHELTHIIFREYLKASSLPLWLDEGVAVYVQEEYGGQRAYKHQLYKLKAAIDNNSYIKLSELTGINAQTLNSKSKDFVTLFYLESFSIVNFLMKKYGRYRFSQFLSCLRRGLGPQEALAKTYYYLKDFNALEEHWKDYYD